MQHFNIKEFSYFADFLTKVIFQKFKFLKKFTSLIAFVSIFIN